jgi:hypothetical protein
MEMDPSQSESRAATYTGVDRSETREVIACEFFDCQTLATMGMDDVWGGSCRDDRQIRFGKTPDIVHGLS